MITQGDIDTLDNLKYKASDAKASNTMKDDLILMLNNTFGELADTAEEAIELADEIIADWEHSIGG